MNIPADLKYTKSHEWVRIEEKKAYIGITDFGQNDLGDIFFVELPDLGAEVDREDIIGSTESAKAVSSLVSPAKGKVVELNESLADAPDGINGAPYENWVIAIELSDEGDIHGLMNDLEYKEFCNQQS